MARIQTQLCTDERELESALGPTMAEAADAVVLLSLGVAATALGALAARAPADTPVLLADCYGVLGLVAAAGKNVELMEAGRGQEYGGVGGDGGRGVVGVVFSGGSFVATTDTLPAGATSHLVVATSGSAATSLLSSQGSAPYHGGVAKAAFRYSRASSAFERVPHFFVSTRPVPDRTVGVTSFTTDPAESIRQLLAELPAGFQAEAVGLFPCFMRGKNQYGKNNVEPDAVGELLPGVPLFGMFCHGELGPRRCLGFDSAEPPAACTQHSMTSIVGIYASRPGAA